MRKAWMLSLVIALGCNDATKDIEKLADRACACADAACANQVIDDLVAFARAHKSAAGDADKARKAGERIGRCAITAGVTPADLVEKLKALQSL